MAGLILAGLVMDLGLLAFARVRLDHATEAAARAVAAACQGGGADPACATDTAGHYLQANMPGAALELVTVEPSRVTVQASVQVPYAFEALWNAAPAPLESHYTIGSETQ